MLHPDKKYFDVLKADVALVLKKTHPDVSEKMEDWNLRTIEWFQTDLQKKVQSSISTKWFYTHIKSATGEKIPRTDVLNLLAQYAGHENWIVFLAKHKPVESVVEIPEPEPPAQVNAAVVLSVDETEKTRPAYGRKKAVLTLGVILGTLAMLLISWMVMGGEDNVTYNFCFVDANFRQALTTKKIEVQVLDELQSPQVFKCDSTACIKLVHKPGKVRFVVKADYCIADTIVRIFEKEGGSETIELRTDDYALMISIFSSSGVEDWEKRRSQLERMFDEEAEIYQLNEENMMGMEMYNKEEFINKMTMPLQSLKNVVVLATEYKNKKIVSLKFYIKEK